MLQKYRNNIIKVTTYNIIYFLLTQKHRAVLEQGSQSLDGNGILASQSYCADLSNQVGFDFRQDSR